MKYLQWQNNNKIYLFVSIIGNKIINIIKNNYGNKNNTKIYLFVSIIGNKILSKNKIIMVTKIIRKYIYLWA